MYDSDVDAIGILSQAKVAAFVEVLDRAFDAGRSRIDAPGGETPSIYEAAEAWRTASNAYDHVSRAIRVYSGLEAR